MALLLDGRKVAIEVKTILKQKIESLQQMGVNPGLAVILVGEDPASRIYADMLRKTAKTLGICFYFHKFPADTTQEQLIKVIKNLNGDKDIHGILPLMPLPKQLDADGIAESILPDKDVDSIHPYNVGLVSQGKSTWSPCTPRAVMRILDYYKTDFTGKKVVIIGRSQVVGKPMLSLLLARNATVTICHSFTKDLAAEIQRADIVVAAVGKPGLVTGSMLKPGAVVADVGINEIDGNIIGDVDFESAAKVAGAITPVPGGVGTVSTVMVMEAVLRELKER